MTRRLVVLPEAEEDIQEAMRWYERRWRGLGAELLGCVEHARYRRIVVRRFPYVVFIEVRVQDVEVVAAAHASRAPGFWLARR